MIAVAVRRTRAQRRMDSEVSHSGDYLNVLIGGFVFIDRGETRSRSR